MRLPQLSGAERRLTAALLLSAVVHALLIGSPAWRLPADEEIRSVPIEARLLPPPKLGSAPPPAEAAPAPQPRPAKPRAAAPELPRTEVAQPEPVVPMEAPAAQEPAAAPEAGAEQALPAESAPSETAAAPAVSEAAPAPDDFFPEHGRVIYAAGYGAFRIQLGTAETVWLVRNGRYEFRLYAQPALGHTLTYRSEGRVSASGFEPASFRVEQAGQFKEGAVFDRGQRRVLVASGRGHSESEMVEPSQDMLSAMFQIALFPPAEERTEMWVATGKRYSSRILERVGEEELDTPLGKLRTVHVRLQREGEDQYDFWFGVDVHYLPVRVRLAFRGGTTLDFPAREIQYDKGSEKIRLVPSERPEVPRG